MPAHPECWYLTGPTASGKTGVAMELAERLNAEIISLDSMAVYREMDIGTAKPSDDQRNAVPHHLLDVVSPDEDFSLSQYLDLAHQCIEDIRSRDREVLFVGGTPLYLKSMLRGLFHGPPADWEFRNAIEEELKTVGTEALHQRLQQVDPLLADKLHPNDKRRIIRALEVYRVTGEPLSHLQREFEEGRTAEQCRVFALQWPRDVLHHRMEARVDDMFERGLLEEINQLLQRYGDLSRTATQAVGYREGLAHLRGETELATCIELVKARTRQFGRRQETWFRSLTECRFVEMRDERTPGDLADHIVAEAS